MRKYNERSFKRRLRKIRKGIKIIKDLINDKSIVNPKVTRLRSIKNIEFILDGMPNLLRKDQDINQSDKAWATICLDSFEELFRVNENK